MDAGRGLDTMGPNTSRSLLFWLVLVLPLLVDVAVGASVCQKGEKLVSQVENRLTLFEETTLWDYFNSTRHNSLMIIYLNSLRTYERS